MLLLSQHNLKGIPCPFQEAPGMDLWHHIKVHHRFHQMKKVQDQKQMMNQGFLILLCCQNQFEQLQEKNIYWSHSNKQIVQLKRQCLETLVMLQVYHLFDSGFEFDQIDRHHVLQVG